MPVPVTVVNEVLDSLKEQFTLCFLNFRKHAYCRAGMMHLVQSLLLPPWRLGRLR